MTTSRISGFYNLPIEQRRAKLAESADLHQDELAPYILNGGLSTEAADHMIENVIGIHALPLGIGLNFRVNGKDVLVPMAIEEPSVVAGASFMAKIARAGGGFQSTTSDPLMIGLLGQAHAQAGDTAEARALLRQLDALPAGIPRNGARAHVELGLRDTTAAFAALEQATTDREPVFAAEPLGTELFAAIRRTPHFTALLGKLGFSVAAATAIRGSR